MSLHATRDVSLAATTESFNNFLPFLKDTLERLAVKIATVCNRLVRFHSARLGIWEQPLVYPDVSSILVQIRSSRWIFRGCVHVPKLLRIFNLAGPQTPRGARMKMKKAQTSKFHLVESA